MLVITTQEVEFTADGTLLEVLRVVDVKDPVVPIRLLVREWLDESQYREVDVPGDFIPDFVPEWLATWASARERRAQDDTHYRRDPRGYPHTPGDAYRPFHRARAQERRRRKTWPQSTPRLSYRTRGSGSALSGALDHRRR